MLKLDQLIRKKDLLLRIAEQFSPVVQWPCCFWAFGEAAYHRSTQTNLKCAHIGWEAVREKEGTRTPIYPLRVHTKWPDFLLDSTFLRFQHLPSWCPNLQPKSLSWYALSGASRTFAAPAGSCGVPDLLSSFLFSRGPSVKLA